jgi:hypothetical protein
MHSYRFAERFQIPVYVDFGNVRYSYSMPAWNQGIANFWDRYIDQTRPENGNKVLNLKIENYPLRIWDRNLLREFNRHFCLAIRFKEILDEKLKEIQKSFLRKNLLGIHIRRTDHSNEVPPADLSGYWKAVEKMEKSHDQLFLATDDLQILNTFRERFGDRLITNPVTRSQGSKSIHGSFSANSEIDLAMEAMIDCFSLSQCTRVILSPSNFSYAALIMNPELEYVLIESSAARWNRRKTSLLYYLDKWGIRRW